MMGCYHQGCRRPCREAVSIETEALQHTAMPLRSAHEDRAAREGDRLRRL